MHLHVDGYLNICCLVTSYLDFRYVCHMLRSICNSFDPKFPLKVYVFKAWWLEGVGGTFQGEILLGRGLRVLEACP